MYRMLQVVEYVSSKFDSTTSEMVPKGDTEFEEKEVQINIFTHSHTYNLLKYNNYVNNTIYRYSDINLKQF